MTLLSAAKTGAHCHGADLRVFLTQPGALSACLRGRCARSTITMSQRHCQLMDRKWQPPTETRFVIITHNPITMARIEPGLFGVTHGRSRRQPAVPLTCSTSRGIARSGLRLKVARISVEAAATNRIDACALLPPLIYGEGELARCLRDTGVLSPRPKLASNSLSPHSCLWPVERSLECCQVPTDYNAEISAGETRFLGFLIQIKGASVG